jgi:hypothetical protein
MSEQIKKLFQRYPQMIICGVLSIIFLALIYFRSQSLPSLQEKSSDVAKKLDVMIKNETQGKELADQLSELKRLTSGLNSRLMSVDDKAANAQFFYDIEGRSRASIADLKQGAFDVGDGSLRPKLGQFTGVSFNLSVSGRVMYLMNFLKRLENGKYFVRCNSLTMRGNGTLGPDAMDIVLKLEVLAKKP